MNDTEYDAEVDLVVSSYPIQDDLDEDLLAAGNTFLPFQSITFYAASPLSLSSASTLLDNLRATIIFFFGADLC